jgi:cyclomaltodextrinase / maltogenic alpha-amylase / neopullulanase
MDFIFGTFSTDELKLVHHRAAQRGVQHAHNRTPRDPLPGQEVVLSVTTGSDFNAARVVCCYTTDGSEPRASKEVALNGTAIALKPVEVLWDTLSWGYLTRWQGVIPAQAEGTVVRYRISAWGDSEELYADSPNPQIVAEHAAGAFFRNEPLPTAITPDAFGGTTFIYHTDRHHPPVWAREAVIYHIFVDRFYHGDGKTWLQTDDLNAICGGTLWGVIEKLDYVTELGANCIWLSPTFVSSSHHGYDATDYMHTEPRMGGDEALRTLVKAAHQRGLRVLLDLACNHISNEHPIFQEALKNPASPYRAWFTFDNSPVGYRAFFGVPTMPQINVENENARRWLFEIAQYWLREFDVDGYRLDYANGPGASFWGDFRAACRAVKPDALCFGEVIDTPDAQRAYIGQLDGCLDFHAAEALRKTYGWGSMDENALTLFLNRHQAFFGDDFIRPTFLDNHDMDRFLFVAKGDKNALKRAAAVQMRLPNPPIIYYGTEVGLNQTISTQGGVGLHVNRVPMIWGDQQDKDLLDYYKSLIQARRFATPNSHQLS